MVGTREDPLMAIRDRDIGSAHSLDGRSFSYAASAGSPLIAGDLVLLTTEEGDRLCGQLRAKEAQSDLAVGTGVILGGVGADGSLVAGARDPFTTAALE